MTRILLEGGIVVLLVLMGISVFVPSSDVKDAIVDFENSIENGEEVNDGELENINMSIEEDVNFISKMNCKIGNVLVNGLNSFFEFGMKILRIIVNWGII